MHPSGGFGEPDDRSLRTREISTVDDMRVVMVMVMMMMVVVVVFVFVVMMVVLIAVVVVVVVVVVVSVGVSDTAKPVVMESEGFGGIEGFD